MGHPARWNKNNAHSTSADKNTLIPNVFNKVSCQTVVFLAKYLEDSSLQKQQILSF